MGKKSLKYLRSFWHWTFAEKKFFLEALLFLYLAKILLLLLPFKTCLKFIKQKHPGSYTAEEKELLQLKTALTRANRLAFWKNVCLVQSFAARWMLQRRKIPSVLSIGVAHDPSKKLIAHAWIKVSDWEIVDKGLDYKELYTLN